MPKAPVQPTAREVNPPTGLQQPTGLSRTHKAVCAKCLRPLEIWPDKVLHKDARFDLACFPEHHEAVEL
jgi:hypothetical protein